MQSRLVAQAETLKPNEYWVFLPNYADFSFQPQQRCSLMIADKIEGINDEGYYY